MQAEIITIGDEILIGQIVDTNSAWIGEQLNLNGIKLHQITSISDDEEHIFHTLESIHSKTKLVLMTGGLGPTKDDITKHTLTRYFKTELKFHEPTYEHVKQLFARFNIEMTETNRKQAELPESCTIITNNYGTAPGMWFEKDGVVFVSMPGVPYEMKKMVENEILPKIKEHFRTPTIIHRTVLTQGIGESFLADKIVDWENSLGAEGIKLAYLPSPGIVRLRLSIWGDNETDLLDRVNRKIKELQELIPQYIYGYEKEQFEEIIGRLLRERKQTLSTAESCTGGRISHLVTSVPGSSEYFMGGVVSYSYKSKEDLLGVKKETLEKYGAVSEETVIEMAHGAKERFNTDYAISVSGIAGPGGGLEDKPVGTVWMALASPNGIKTKKFTFGDNRERNIVRSSLAALNMLRKEILGENQ